MRQALLLAFILSTGLAAIGCEGDSKVERAAAVAKAIQKNPKKAEAILEEHEMTIEEFESLMYEVAADPELSEAYAKALGEKKSGS